MRGQFGLPQGVFQRTGDRPRQRPKQTCKTKGASIKKAALLLDLVSAIFPLSLNVAASGELR